MKTTPLTWRELLASQPALPDPEAVEQRLTAEAAAEDHPRILNFFAGVGAWVSAHFILPFFFLLNVFDTASGCAAVGLLLFGGALALSRQSSHVFLSQLALSGLLGGNALILISAFIGSDDLEVSFALLVGVQAVLAWLACLFFQGVVGRFITLVGVPALAVAWVFSAKSAHGLHGITGLLALGAGLLFIWEKRPAGWDVVAWAALLSLPGVILLTELLHGQSFMELPSTPLWPSSLIAGLLLIALVTVDAGGWKTTGQRWWWMLVAATLFLAAFTTPGLVVALVLLFLGHSLDERWLTIVGHAFFAAFLVLFYYALNISLAQKSWIIAGSGLFLLVLRFWLGKSFRKEATP